MSNEVIIYNQKINDKILETGYEAGSGSLYIPVLGDLFPKLWGQQMKSIDKYYLFVNDKKHIVSRQIYDSIEIGDCINLYLKDGYIIRVEKCEVNNL